MGVVYKARQKSLNRLVALKLLAPERADDPQFAARFEKEAHALAALNHPNIVGVYDFGQAGGFYYLLMEFVDGVNLRQLLQTKRLTPKEALSIVPPVCEALQCAHDHGIVHRDIKPENLLMDRAGTVKIADFGIAKMVTDPSDLTDLTDLKTSHAHGTPDYAAPEQQNGSADHRADIYSLGVVLYEMLTGERPNETLTPPSKRVQVDIRIDEIVLKALERTPELRFQTAADFRTQVEAAVSPSAPTILKTTSAVVMTPAALASFKGQFGLAFTRGPLVLDGRKLVHRTGSNETVIPLSAVEDVSLGHLPRAINPTRLQVISISYREGNTLKRLLVSPWEKIFDAPWCFNRRVEEWHQAIRAAVAQCTGKEPGTTPEDQLGLPSSAPATIGIVALPVVAMMIAILLMALDNVAHDLPMNLGWLPLLVPLAGYAVVWLLPWIVGLASGRDSGPWYRILALAGVWWFAVLPVLLWLADIPRSQNTRWLALLLMLVAAPLLVGLASRKWRQWQAVANGTRWLKAWSWVGWCLAVPAVGFAAFFIHAAASERGGWHPSPNEMWAVPLIFLAALSLPPFAASLWVGAGGKKRTFLGSAMSAVAAITVGVLAFSGGMAARPYLLRSDSPQRPFKVHLSPEAGSLLFSSELIREGHPRWAEVRSLPQVQSLNTLEKSWEIRTSRPAAMTLRHRWKAGGGCESMDVCDQPAGNTRLYQQSIGVLLYKISNTRVGVRLMNDNQPSTREFDADFFTLCKELGAVLSGDRLNTERDWDIELCRIAGNPVFLRIEDPPAPVEVERAEAPNSAVPIPAVEPSEGISLFSPVIGAGLPANAFRAATILAKPRHVAVLTLEAESAAGKDTLAGQSYYHVVLDDARIASTTATWTADTRTDGLVSFRLEVTGTQAKGKLIDWSAPVEWLNGFEWTPERPNRSYWVGPGEWNLNETNALPIFQGVKRGDPSQKAVIRLHFALYRLPEGFQPAKSGQVFHNGTNWRTDLGLPPDTTFQPIRLILPPPKPDSPFPPVNPNARPPNDGSLTTPPVEPSTSSAKPQPASGAAKVRQSNGSGTSPEEMLMRWKVNPSEAGWVDGQVVYESRRSTCQHVR
jgi:serine/threonine protein kinase